MPSWCYLFCGRVHSLCVCGSKHLLPLRSHILRLLHSNWIYQHRFWIAHVRRVGLSFFYSVLYRLSAFVNISQKSTSFTFLPLLLSPLQNCFVDHFPHNLILSSYFLHASSSTTFPYKEFFHLSRSSPVSESPVHVYCVPPFLFAAISGVALEKICCLYLNRFLIYFPGLYRILSKRHTAPWCLWNIQFWIVLLVESQHFFQSDVENQHYLYSYLYSGNNPKSQFEHPTTQTEGNRKNILHAS